MKKQVYSAVICDFDGTIVDSMPDILFCMKAAYAKEGVYDAIPVPEHIGPPLRECLKLITPGLANAVLEKVGEKYRNKYDTSNYPNTLVYPEVKETLDFLEKEKIKLYLVTNKRSVATLRMLKIFKLEYFLSVISPDIKSSEQVSKTEMLAFLLKKEKIKPENALYVGDSVMDIFSAHANMLKAVAVTYGYNTKKQLKKAGPDYIIDSFEELIKITGVSGKGPK
ncbi:MAG: HAD hydrolase-like protein [Candidatus Firestonebacteria bacterium]